MSFMDTVFSMTPKRRRVHLARLLNLRQYCLPILEEAVKKDKMLKTTNTNNIRFNEYGFDFSYKNDGNEKYYILVWDLIENLENE